MSFFGGSSGPQGGGRSHSDSERLRSSSHHQSRGHSPSRSTSNGYYTRPAASRSNNTPSFFNTNLGSSRGIFGGSSSGSSYYKRRPRDGYISYLYHKLQRMVKELWVYARRHPVKAFFAVVVPLLSAGGAIHGLLKQFNIRLPFVDALGGGGMGRGGGGYYGSKGYDGGGMGGGMGGAGGLMENAGSLMQMAKLFM
ncbi:hypothetical protein LTR62_003742 [Meristemomyces frigidus]|uniref:Uncharacterized protein n=1 Tax=Meristemomyces frigidus TaxID=1508187 RepID=A0AAN7TNI9_9PEZI|nr:hypothetical protein LTR62_003742 [Meristemomyces frigidus]